MSGVDGSEPSDRCQFVELPDGTTARLYGADEPLSDDARDAFATVVKAARELFAEEHDDMPALAAVADAFAHRARTSGLSLAEAAEKVGCGRVAAIRLMQCSEKLTVAELAAFARWAGLDIVAVPADGQDIQDARPVAFLSPPGPTSVATWVAETEVPGG